MPNDATIATRQQHEQGGAGEPGVQAEQAGPGARRTCRRAAPGRARRRPTTVIAVAIDLAREVGAVDAGDRPEQEAGEVAGVAAALARHHDDGEGEEADEQDPDRGVVGQRRGGPHDVDAGDHHEGGDERAERGVGADARTRWRCPAARRGRGRRRGSSCPAARPTCPTSDVHAAVSSTAHSALTMAWLPRNGSTHHPHGSVSEVHRRESRVLSPARAAAMAPASVRSRPSYVSAPEPGSPSASV